MGLQAEIGATLRRIREARGVSQDALGALIVDKKEKNRTGAAVSATELGGGTAVDLVAQMFSHLDARLGFYVVTKEDEQFAARTLRVLGVLTDYERNHLELLIKSGEERLRGQSE